MDDQRFEMMFQLTQETREELRCVRAELAVIKVQLAKDAGGKEAWGTMGTWVNSVFLILLTAALGFVATQK